MVHIKKMRKLIEQARLSAKMPPAAAVLMIFAEIFLKRRGSKSYDRSTRTRKQWVAQEMHGS